ncbi:MAG: beta-ketoacyl synthase N-terminal-like domain-containing protein, partial [Pseudomonadota bacterium]
MNTLDRFNLRIPIIFVNPYYNVSFDLIANVYQHGSIGIIDHVTAGQSRISPDGKTPYGVRCHISDPMIKAGNDLVKLAIIPVEDSAALGKTDDGELLGAPFPAMVEVANLEDLKHAERVGASGVIVKGAECGGWASKTHGFVLLQQILQSSRIPVFLQGGIGPCTAAGAIRAGASGIVIDYHLLLTAESALDEETKNLLGNLDIPSSVCLNHVAGIPFRAYSRIGTKKIRKLKKIQESMTSEISDNYRNIIADSIGYPSPKPDMDDSVFPFSEDLVVNSEFLKKIRSASEVISLFVEAMRPRNIEWPFAEGSIICGEHGSKYPVVQGPMAHVSDNSDFLKSVSEGGGLPFLALGNMPRPIAEEAMSQAGEELGQSFGVGLIGLEVNRSRYEAHLEIMKANPPKFAILAAGGPDLALTIEKMGSYCYLHCPSPGVLREALKSGLRRFVFEGGESGGHIASLTSLNLWNANLNLLEKAHKEGLDLKDVRVLFAGGIGSPIGVAFIAGMAAQLVEKGLKIGIQMGTAYLSTGEAVKCGAITERYQRLTLESNDTLVIGRTVNTMARAACSTMAKTLIKKEHERLRAGISLNERKELYERDNLGALRLASKGCAIDPETSQSDCPRFCQLSPDEQFEKGLYLLGQAASLLNEPTTIEKLHSDLVHGGRAVFEKTFEITKFAKPAGPLPSECSVEDLKTDYEGSCATSGNSDSSTHPGLEFDSEKEPIAIVGIGLRLPGSDSAYKFWRQIMDRRSGIISAPTERWGDIDMYYHPDPKIPDKTYSKIGGFIEDFDFDPLKYRIPPTVAQKMDRTQKMAVACVADALADAGLTPEDLKGKTVGIVIGNSMGGETTDLYAERIGFPRTLAKIRQSLSAANVDETTIDKIADDFRDRFLKGLPEITEDSLPGELANVISGRVANVFNLEGPNFTVDAACASSMAAIMNAVSGLRSRAMDYAIAGGVDASMQPSSFVKFCKIGALSADGSRPFDESANGFVMGEGAGIILMRRLSDAVANGDRVYAVVLDVGSSSDGRGKGITAPNPAGQERAIRACMDSAGVAPSSIGLVEAHGTSTAVGDKTELMMLDSFFRQEGVKPGSVGIGSVKSQIGHLKAASGAAGMIKAILSLHHRTLPPTANIQHPNPCIDWESSPLTLLTEARPWKTVNGTPRRAGVSAFGFGGTNFHVILQEYSPELRLVTSSKISAVPEVKFAQPDWPRPEKFDTKGSVWVVGADNMADLTTKIATTLKTITPLNHKILSQTHRNECLNFDLRVGFASSDVETTSKKMEFILEALQEPSKIAFLNTRGVYFSDGKTKRNSPGAAFIFPGQGSQYPYMLRDLCERFPIVAETFR